MRSPRSALVFAGGLAFASMAGMALTSDGWRLVLAGLAVVAAGAFGGLLASQGRSLQLTVVVLGVLTYLVIVPVLGFASRGLQERWGMPSGWWIPTVIAVLGLLVAFLGARRWRLGRAR